jgi:hypothetical protein
MVYLVRLSLNFGGGGGGNQLIMVSAVQEKLFFVDVNGLVYLVEGGGERLETA